MPIKLQDKIQIIKRKKISDLRGWFLKVITGKESNLPAFTGEVYIISANMGECRANHYHKEAHEWFSLIKGEAEMILEDVHTREQIKIHLTERAPVTVYVPNYIAHAFKNIGNTPYILVTYTDKLFIPEDTIFYQLC